MMKSEENMVCLKRKTHMRSFKTTRAHFGQFRRPWSVLRGHLALLLPLAWMSFQTGQGLPPGQSPLPQACGLRPQSHQAGRSHTAPCSWFRAELGTRAATSYPLCATGGPGPVTVSREQRCGVPVPHAHCVVWKSQKQFHQKRLFM